MAKKFFPSFWILCSGLLFTFWSAGPIFASYCLVTDNLMRLVQNNDFKTASEKIGLEKLAENDIKSIMDALVRKIGAGYPGDYSLLVFCFFKVVFSRVVGQLPYQKGAMGCPGTVSYWLLNSNLSDLFNWFAWPYFDDMIELFKKLSARGNSIKDLLNNAAFKAIDTASNASLKEWNVFKNCLRLDFSFVQERLLFRFNQVGLIGMLRDCAQYRPNFDVDKTNDDYSGKTLLQLAAEKGFFDTVQVLVEELGADVNVVSSGKGTALDLAVEKGYVNVAGYLREHGALSSKTICSKKTVSKNNKQEEATADLFFDKVSQGEKANDINFLACNQCHFTAVDSSGNTIVHKLVERGITKANLERLVRDYSTSVGVNLSKCNHKGYRPYDLAVLYSQDVALKQYLCEQLPWYVKAYSLVSKSMPVVVGILATVYGLRWICQGYSNQIESFITSYGVSSGIHWSVQLPFSMRFPFIKSPLTVTSDFKILPFKSSISDEWLRLVKPI